MRSNVALFILSILVAFMFSGCNQDDIDVPVSSNELIEISESEVMLSAKSQYYTIRITSKKDNLNIRLECDADWITLDNEIVAEDGYVEFLVANDENGVRREGNIIVTAVDASGISTTASCKVIQCDNSLVQLEPDAAQSMRVGYGYNIFGAYMNDNSVKKPILASQYLFDENNDMVETTPYATMDVDKVTAKSLTEMGHILTEKEEQKKSGIGGASKTTTVYTQSEYKREEEQYVHLTLHKSVSMRSLDIGLLTQRMETGESVFSADFENIRKTIIANPSSVNIKKMLNDFGTHLVVYAESGLSIELAVNFKMMIQGSLDMRAEDYADYFFRNKSSEFLLDNGKIADMTTEVKVNSNCIISGGSPEARDALSNEINDKGRPTDATLTRFLSSVDGDGYQYATPVRFQTIPIWDLFPTTCLGAIVNEVNNMAAQSNNKHADSDIGTDYYELYLSLDMFKFGTSSTSTLVKTVWAKGTAGAAWTPILEVCNEYVPQVRGDKRITVFYALRNGRPYHGAGFFPGDGEGNPPAWLTFSGSQVYVKPIEAESVNYRNLTLYYLHGNIYTKDYGAKIRPAYSIKTQDEYLQLGQKYSIVKIGSGYWTRWDMKEMMNFGIPADKDFPYLSCEHLHNNMLYANVLCDNCNPFASKYNAVYGDDIDETTKMRTKWYLPTENDILNLYNYLDRNGKSMFVQGASGFEAGFNGIHGSYNDLTGGYFGDADYHYKGEYNFIPCKNGGSDHAYSLVLSKNYDLRISKIIQDTPNSYPVRLYRTSYYQYK